MPSPTPRTSRPALLAATGLLVLTLGALGGCSGGSPDADSSPAPRVTDSSPPTSDPTEGVPVEGDGYSLTAPPGWADSTDKVKENFAQVDVAAGDTSVDGDFADNVNVIVSDKRRIRTQRKAERILRDELQLVGRKVRIEEPGELDGEVAYHATARLKVGRIKVRTTQFFAQHDKTWYLVTFSYGPNTDAGTEAEEISLMLDSWSWEDGD